MSTSILMVNNIVNFLDEEESERVLWISKDYSYCFTIKMNTEKFRIKKREIKDIESSLEMEIAKKAKDTKHNFRTEKNISKSDLENLEKVKKVIEYIFENCPEPYIYETGYRGEFINKAIEELKVTKASIYKYLRKYLQGGKTIYSILPDYYNCGGRNKAKNLGKQKIGRPPLKSTIQERREGVNVTAEDKKIFINAINKYYMNERETPLTEVYTLMTEEYYNHYIEKNGILKKEVKPAHSIPNIRQFRYWCSKLFEVVKIIEKRKGNSDFENNSQGLKSDSRQETFGPCFKAQIDAKICNVQVVNRLRNNVIGKPTLYFVVDQFSSYIMGMYIGLDNPSWNGVSSALFNCVEDKVEFYARYGIHVEEGKVANSTLPKVILVDRGAEFAGKLLNYAVENLDIIVQNTKSRTPKNKGIVEQSFRTTELKMKTLTPGANKYKIVRRCQRDPRKDALYTIDDITKVYIRIVIHHNNKVIKRHPYVGELIKEGIKPTRINLYKWGLKNLSGSLREYDMDFVKLNLMRRGRATVTEKGIRFKEDCYYDCEKAITEKWYTKARIKGHWGVDICFDDRNMNNIYIINDKDNKFEICTLRQESNFFKGSTYQELEDYEREKNISYNSTYKDDENQNNLELAEALKDINKSVLEERRKNGKKSMPSRKNIPESRKEDNKTYRATQALTLENEVEFDSIPSKEIERNVYKSANPSRDKLKKLQEEIKRDA